jgi:hypothetical protein
MEKWTIRVETKKKKTAELIFAEYTFLSDAKTIDEALEAAWSFGLGCLMKRDGKVMASGPFVVRVFKKDGEFYRGEKPLEIV